MGTSPATEDHTALFHAYLARHAERVPDYNHDNADNHTGPWTRQTDNPPFEDHP